MQLSPYSDSLSLRLRTSQFLTSLHNVTRRSILQKVRDRTLNRAFSACKHRVSGSLSLPSRGSFHLSLTVLCAIGHHIVFRLGRWSSRLPAGFLVSCGTLVVVSISSFRLRAYYPLWNRFPSVFDWNYFDYMTPQPRPTVVNRFGLLPFRSPLLR